LDQNLQDYFRIPLELFTGIDDTAGTVGGDLGFFQFGPNNICYGKCHAGVSKTVEGSGKFDALRAVNPNHNGASLHLPFNFTEVTQNLRLERYHSSMTSGREALVSSELIRRFYSLLRKCLPLTVRRRLQRVYMGDWKNLPFPAWPVDFTVDEIHGVYLRLLMEATGLKRVPFIWFWPQGASNCLIITHDVETTAGRDFTSKLMDMDDSQGFKASFQVVPEGRYDVPDQYVEEIRRRGFEFNIHDLNHDGLLFSNRQEFLHRAARINAFVHKYRSQGFRAGCLYRNQDWYDAFEFSYDMSVPNVARLDPERGGCCTAMPYFVGRIVELPVTTAQDYSVFHILREYSIELWKQQMALIQDKNGLISVLTHPDYLTESRARNVYMKFLTLLRETAERGGVWCALPGDVDAWWRERSQLQLVGGGNKWEIVGRGKERARLAYAVLDGKRLVYEITEASSYEDVCRGK
jgi:hypothetical protein